MNFMSLLKKYASLRIGLGFAVVGLLLAVLGCIALTRPAPLTEKVTATIEEIQTQGVGENKTYTTIVSYRAAGQSYRQPLDTYTSTWQVGDTLECDYEVLDPSRIHYGNGRVTALVVTCAGFAAFAAGVFWLVTAARKPAAQPAPAPAEAAPLPEDEFSDAPPREYIFHFTGKLNQSYVMKNTSGTHVYEANCAGITLVRDTEFEFRNCQTGESRVKKVGHTITHSMGGEGFGLNLDSGFTIDGENCWEVLSRMGYGSSFSAAGGHFRYNITRYGAPVGYAESAGTGLMNPKYADNPLGKLPTKGIFRIQCRPCDITGVFLLCFCLSKTEMSAREL